MRRETVAGALALLTALALSAPLSAETAVCSFTRGVASDVDQQGKRDLLKPTDDRLDLTFVDLETKRPRVVGNLGSSPVTLIRGFDGALNLVEVTDTRSINLVTILPKYPRVNGRSVAFYSRHVDHGFFAYVGHWVGTCAVND